MMSEQLYNKESVKIHEISNSKLARWKSRVLLQAAKPMLIKSSLSGISLFSMNRIKKPNNISKRWIMLTRVILEK